MTELGEYRAHRLLQLYVPPLIIALGTFGNVFAFVILRNKAMLKFSTYFFLMVMSIADTLVLYAGLLPIWIGQLTSVVFRNLSNWSCKMSNVVGYTVRYANCPLITLCQLSSVSCSLSSLVVDSRQQCLKLDTLGKGTTKTDRAPENLCAP